MVKKFIDISGDIYPQEKHTKFHEVNVIKAYLFTALVMSIAGTIPKLYGNIQETYGLGSILGFSGSAVLALWPFYAYIIALIVCFYLLKTHLSDRMVAFAKTIMDWISQLRYVNLVIFIVLIVLFCTRYFLRLDFWVFDNRLEIFVFGHLGITGAILLRGTRKIKPITSLVVSFSVYCLFLFILYWIPDIRAYPLALGWSETTWFYDASLFFSQRLYGFRAPLSSLHPSRYLLQAIPFLIPRLPLWSHRLWQVLLWIFLSLATAWALKQRIKPEKSWMGLAIIVWFTLLVFQGPVYYHLSVVVIIILLSFDKHKLGWSFAFVILASLWAGISRVNWFPIAGMLAATLYILEVPQEEKSFWQYWRWPVLAVILGLLVAFGAQTIYVVISGRRFEDFVTSFNSPLLSYRLFPNQAFGIGILPMLLIASLPSIVLILDYVLPRLRSWQPLRLLGLMSILIVLMVSGIIVSSKIGGGNNLHNLDAFLIFLATVTIYLMFNRFLPENQQSFKKGRPPFLLVLLSGLFLVIFLLDSMSPNTTLDNDRAWNDINKVQEIIDEMVPEGGEVLFIHNRHLLTFNMIKGVKLIPEYEKVFLMEMAMSENLTYLNAFKQDIETHRFDLIVTEPLFIKIIDKVENFSEENNAWVNHVAIPINDSYYRVAEFCESFMFVMTPRR